MSITLNNVVYPAGYIAEDDNALKAGRNYINTDNLTTNNVTLNTNGQPLTWDTTTGTGSPVSVSGALPGGSTDTVLYATPYDTSSFFFLTNNPDPTKATFKFVVSNTPLTADTRYTADNDPGLTEYTASPPAPCFASGTRIRAIRGKISFDIAVEDLRVGDDIVTASGGVRPVVWIGHSTVDCRSHDNTNPVHVAANAFGENLPERDLTLSPGHPVLVGADADNEGGWLVPIMCLVNGTTIERLSVDEVTYWHVELDAHDILLAEGLPAESYLDWGDRPFFGEAEAHALMNPDFVVPGLAGRCRPVALDGPVVEAERLRLDAVFAGRLEAASAWPVGETLAW